MPIYHEPIYQQIHLLSVYFSKLIERLLSMGIGFIIAVDNNSNLDSKKALLKYSLGNKSKIYIIEASEQK